MLRPSPLLSPTSRLRSTVDTALRIYQQLVDGTGTDGQDFAVGDTECPVVLGKTHPQSVKYLPGVYGVISHTALPPPKSTPAVVPYMFPLASKTTAPTGPAPPLPPVNWWYGL